MSYHGFKMTDEQKRKISLAHKGLKAWNSRDRITNEEIINEARKYSARNVWRLAHKSLYYLAKQRGIFTECVAHMPRHLPVPNFTGHQHSDFTKTIMTVKRAARCAALGHPGCVDAGATEFFNNLNQTQGFHIQHPNIYFKELGYFADGYDPVLHAWFEYDTPVHRWPKIKMHDLHRQATIIEYFKIIKKPLIAFFRINTTGRGEPGIKNFI